MTCTLNWRIWHILKSPPESSMDSISPKPTQPSDMADTDSSFPAPHMFKFTCILITYTNLSWDSVSPRIYELCTFTHFEEQCSGLFSLLLPSPFFYCDYSVLVFDFSPCVLVSVFFLFLFADQLTFCLLDPVFNSDYQYRFVCAWQKLFGPLSVFSVIIQEETEM